MSAKKFAVAGALALSLVLGGCAAGYQLVEARPVAVAKGTITVAPSTAWNRMPRRPFDIAEEENWTANGPLLDSIGFIGGLADGKAIVKQRRKDQQQVPVFRASMSPQDLVSMVESFYRIRNDVTVFEPVKVEPARFLGSAGLRFDYAYVGADGLRRRGRAVMSVIDERLYLMALDAAQSHYFDAALPEFDRIAEAARRS